MESGKIAITIMDIMMKKFEYCKNEFEEIRESKDRMLAYQLINDTYTQWDICFEIGLNLITDQEVTKIFRDYFKNISCAIDTFLTDIGRWDN